MNKIKKIKYLLIVSFLLIGFLFSHFFYSFYKDIIENEIKKLNDHQEVLAKQAANSIEIYFNTYISKLNNLSKDKDVLSLNENGKRRLRLFYDGNKDNIQSISYVDKKGVIKYTYPFESYIGENISQQNHIKKILREKDVVISDVFASVQGLRCISIAYPLFIDKEFKGIIGFLIPFRQISKLFLEDIKVKKSGYSWVLSENKNIIFCPNAQVVAQNIKDLSVENVGLGKIIDNMLLKKTGRDFYFLKNIKKHVVYYPVNLRNTFWSIAIAVNEDDVLGDIKIFRNRFLYTTLFFIFFLILLLYLFFEFVISIQKNNKIKNIKQNLDQAQQLSNIGSWEYHSDSKEFFVSDQLKKIYGIEEELDQKEMIQYLRDCIHSSDKVFVDTQINDFLKNKKVYYYNYRIVKNGEIRWIRSINKEIVYKPNGSFKLVGVIQDVTDSINIHNQLEELKNYLSNIINSMPSVVVGIDCRLNVEQWNNQAVKLTNISQEKALGSNIFECIHELKEDKEIIIDAIKNKKTLKFRQKECFRNNTMMCLEITVFPLNISDENGAVIIIDDITDKKRLESMVIQSEKMNSLGGMAGGMAHEINNPLSGILQSIQNIKRRLDTGFSKNIKISENIGVDIKKVYEYIEQREILKFLSGIEESGHRASAIVQNMLNFSRKTVNNKKVCNVNLIIDKTLGLVTNDFNVNEKYDFKKVKIVKQFSSNNLFLSCNEQDLEQAFYNILKNSAQAFLAYSVSNPEIIIKTELIDHKILISFKDNGPGMDDNTKGKLFEPFFTTKKIGEGTGLGLSVVYFIIKQNHHGEIYVFSEPGKGTRFDIYIPI